MGLLIGLIQPFAGDPDNPTREDLEQVCRERWFGEEAVDELTLLRRSMDCMAPEQLDRFLQSGIVGAFVQFHARRQWLYKTTLESNTYSIAHDAGLLQRLTELSGQAELEAHDLRESMANAERTLKNDWDGFQARFKEVPGCSPTRFRDWLGQLKGMVDTHLDAGLIIG